MRILAPLFAAFVLVFAAGAGQAASSFRFPNSPGPHPVGLNADPAA